MAQRWRILLNAMNLEPVNASAVVKACVVLHNFLCESNQGGYMPPEMLDREVDGLLVKGDWRKEKRLQSVRFGKENNAATSGKSIREKYCAYFNVDAGAVPWQDAATFGQRDERESSNEGDF